MSAKEIELAGIRFSTSLYKSRYGHKLLKKLVQISKKTISVVGETIAKKGESDLEVDEFLLKNGTQLFLSIADAMSDLPDEEYTDLMMRILSTTLVFETNGPVQLTPEKFDDIFSGKYVDSFSLITEVLRFQYHDFLSRLGAVLSTMDSQEKKPKQPIVIRAK